MTAWTGWYRFRAGLGAGESKQSRPGSADWVREGMLVRLGVSAAIVGIYLLTVSEWLFWLLAVTYLTAELVLARRRGQAEGDSTTLRFRVEIGALLSL